MEELILACQWDQASFLIFSDNFYAPLVYYSHFFAIGASLLVGFFIYLSNKKELVNNLLFGIIIFLSLWLFGDLVLWGSERLDMVMFFWAFINICEPIVYALSLYFLYVFVDKKDISITKKVSILLLLLPTILLSVTKLGLIGYDLSNCDRAAIEGPLAQYGYLIEFVFTGWIVVAAIRRFRQTVDKNLRKQIVIMAVALISFLLMFSLGNIVEVFTENWGIGQIGLLGVPVFVGLLGYLIVRYQTFSIKLIASQALVWALGFLIFATLFVRTLGNIKIVIGATLVLVIAVGYLLVKSVKREVEQREKIESLAFDLANANEKLKSLDRLKTEFLSLASHQLRSPLTAIKGYASMLIEESFGKLADKQEVAVRRVYASAEGLTNIVEDLLNVSKIEQGGMKYEFVDTDLIKIVSDLYEEMKIPAGLKNLEFTIDVSKEGVIMAKVDPVKLKQVFLNIVDNSIKYTPKGFIKMSLYKENNNAVFNISDNGIGMSAETIQTIFDKFTRGEGKKVNTGGSGLGMYLANQIVKAHNGRIEIISEGVGKGSTFKVIIPA